MKILINDNVYGWRMTGLLGKGGKWFLGFSRQLKYGASRGHTLYGIGSMPNRAVCNAKECT